MDTAVVLSMLSLQVTRRLYESLFVSVFSSSARMHLLHYALGLFFYPAVALTALIHLDTVDHLEGIVESPSKGQPFTSESRTAIYLRIKDSHLEVQLVH